MYVEIKGRKYRVNIIKKKNKNTYIRISDENTIVISTNYLMPDYKILELINQNIDSIEKMLLKYDNSFYYLGKKYDIIVNDNVKDVLILEDTIFVNNDKILDKWLKKEALRIFADRLEFVYHNFEENIIYPKLKIRNMKTRWGVCNKKGYITLNLNLIKYSIKEIDYVIVHELSHYVHFNHSKDFWNLVLKYCPDYKVCRKALKGW